MSSPSTTTAPYPPSALNRLFAAIERLPGGGWWVYPVMLVALVPYYQASLWVIGIRPVGSLAVDGLAGLVYGPYVIAACHYFTRIAGTAMAAFRPASGLGDAAYARRRYELVTLPTGRLWVALVGTIIAVGSMLSASAEAIAPYGGTLIGDSWWTGLRPPSGTGCSRSSPTRRPDSWGGGTAPPRGDGDRPVRHRADLRLLALDRPDRHRVRVRQLLGPARERGLPGRKRDRPGRDRRLDRGRRGLLHRAAVGHPRGAHHEKAPSSGARTFGRTPSRRSSTAGWTPRTSPGSRT